MKHFVFGTTNAMSFSTCFGNLKYCLSNRTGIFSEYPSLKQYGNTIYHWGQLETGNTTNNFMSCTRTSKLRKSKDINIF